MILAPAVLFFIITLLLALFRYLKQKKYELGTKSFDDTSIVPLVSGALPFVGHGLYFITDMFGLMSSSCRKYGNIFQIQLFRKKLIVICDRKIACYFYKEKENTASLSLMFDNFSFDKAFSSVSSFDSFLGIIKQLQINQPAFDEVILAQLAATTKLWREKYEKSNHPSGPIFPIFDEIKRLVNISSFEALTSIKLTNEIYKSINVFLFLSSAVASSSFLLPKKLTDFIMANIVARFRKPIFKYFEPIVDQCRQNPNSIYSTFLKTILVYRHPSGKLLTNEEVYSVFLMLIFSTENVGVALANAIIDLARRPTYLEMIKAETIKDMASWRAGKSVFTTRPFVSACIKETVRRSPNVIPLSRYVINKNLMLGKYYMGNADIISVCTPMLMHLGHAANIFSDPGVYNPLRYLGNNPEPSTNKYLIAWGAGVHVCPGEAFSKNLMGVMLPFLLHEFEFCPEQERLKELVYFVLTTIAKRKTTVRIRQQQ